MIRRLALALMLAGVAGCVPRAPAPVARIHYVVDGGYELGGVWSYPREAFQSDETGLASVLPDRRGLTADGEAYDGTAMVAAHRTLQLPCIVRVTNLDTGLATLVRVNDRGPAMRGRVIGLSRRAAAVLGVAPGQAAKVRVQVEDGMSQALRAQLGGGPVVAVAAAPRGSVTVETLAPPQGMGQSRRGRDAGVARPMSASMEAAEVQVPDRLPDVAERGAAPGGRLVIRAGSFGPVGYAQTVQAKLGGIGARVERVPEGRGERYEVVAGPFADVGAADSALDQAVRAGVGDARIVIE